MSVKVAVTPRSVLIDTKTGRPTRDLFLLLEYLSRITADVSALVVDDAIVNGVTDRAPSQNAVFDTFALYTTTANLVSTLLEDAITDSQTSKAPTSNAVFDALALKLSTATAAATYLTIANAAATYLPLAGGTLTGPLVLPSYTVATVPAAATYARGLIYVSDETGGATVAFSDGIDWRRVQDRAVIS